MVVQGMSPLKPDRPLVLLSNHTCNGERHPGNVVLQEGAAVESLSRCLQKFWGAIQRPALGTRPNSFNDNQQAQARQIPIKNLVLGVPCRRLGATRSSETDLHRKGRGMDGREGVCSCLG
jgi:hypothetical protein